MLIDPAWLTTLLAMPDLATRDTLDIDGVQIELPVASSGGRQRLRQWQRRVLSDVIPDSVNADAPERTPFRMLFALTTSQGTPRGIEEALSGDLAPLEGVFRAETRTKQKKMTLAFHVLAVKAASKGESEAKGYTERTLMLLCRRADGTIDVDLMRDLIEQFRRAPDQLDLAQRTLLNALHEGWTPAEEPLFNLPEAARIPEVPFDGEAGKLFQEDLRSLLRASLPPADFFQQLNLLFTIHLGMYQPRVATVLNPQMDLLRREMADPNPANLRDLDALLAKFARQHPFYGKLNCRAPDPELRAVNLRTPARASFEALSNTLAEFHFNVLLLVQLRRLGEAYFANKWDQLASWREGHLDRDTARVLAERVRGPHEFISAMAEYPDYGRFLHRALAALAVRFIHSQQIAETDRDDALKKLAAAPSALDGLRHLYERYNIQSSPNKSNSRAYRQGMGITSGLLQQGQYGLVQSRQRVGSFFEVGAGLLPLLILLAVGPGNEKVPVTTFWARLAAYGLSFDSDERQRLLGRLRSMGVYERYSDAGEAAYVRNLMTTTRAA